MNLALTTVATASADVARASSFYTTAFTGTSTEAGERVELDLDGAGRFAIEPADEAAVVTEAVEPSAWGGVVFSYILDQPAEVRAIMDIALRQGARRSGGGRYATVDTSALEVDEVAHQVLAWTREVPGADETSRTTGTNG